MADYGSELYYREVLLKKEGSKNWVEYYATLVGNKLIFDKRDTNPHLLHTSSNMIEINNKTICHFGDKKTCYRFPFSIQNGKMRYDFKCETKLQRHKWLYAIRLCALGKPPEKIPNFIPTKAQGTKTKSRASSASNKGRKLHYTITNGGIEQRHNSAKQNGSTQHVLETKLGSTINLSSHNTNGSVTHLQKTNNHVENIHTNGHNQPPLFTRSKSDLESSKKKEKIVSRPMYRSGSSDFESESLKHSKKTVKWDLRNVISYVSKTLHVDSYNVASNSKLRKNHEQKQRKTSNEHVLQSSVVENHYVDKSLDESVQNLQSCINKTKKRRKSEDRHSTSSNDLQKPIFKRSLSDEYITQSNGVAHFDQSDAFVKFNNRCIDENDFEKDMLDKSLNDLQVTAIEDLTNISDDDLIDEWESTPSTSTFGVRRNSIDSPIRDDETCVDLSDTDNSQHFDDHSYIYSNGERRSSLVKYRSDGHIETFLDSHSISQDNLSPFLTSDRFGRRQSTDSKAVLQNFAKLKRCGERAQSWAALNVLSSPQTKPTRRESSAPPLRFSRHKFEN